MEQDLNKLMQQIGQLPSADKSKLLTFLMYQTSALSKKDIETIEFLTASSERLKKWMEDTDKVIEETEEFLNDIKRTA